MEPKFQSSFIPKGPVATTAPDKLPKGRKPEGKSFFGYIALLIFIISVIFAVGVFGYKYYLKYSIQSMGDDLENARATLQSDAIQELTRLDKRIISSKELIAKHRIVSPALEFLEIYTPKTVRFNDFRYSMAEQGIELSMKGEARSYSALAFQADIFDNSQYFENPVFSDLTLNERGDVTFSFKAIVNPGLVSYQRKVEQIGLPPVESVEQTETVEQVPVSTSTGTSLPSTQNQTQTQTQNQNEE